MKTIRINPADNVSVALTDIKKDEAVDSVDGLNTKEDIERGHKIALEDIKEGSPVIKYGNVIGYATKDIVAGTHVHTHNIKTGLSEKLEYEYTPVSAYEHKPLEGLSNSFMGCVRKNGEVGIRNEIWIIPTVACVNDIAKKIVENTRGYLKEDGGSIDDIVTFSHPYGCSQLEEDKETTERILADLCTHPNAGGVLLLSLGCENSGIEHIRDKFPEHDESRIRYLVCQDVEDELAEGEKLVKELIDAASKDKREAAGVDRLVVGLKCGGSDGLSGISANPLLGRVADEVIARGGSCILTEVPEMFGAERILMNRCRDRKVFDELVSMINGFKDYFISNGQSIYENPSPGNKKGGISTLEDKSLGCTQKSGSSPVNGVLGYGECIKEQGLNLLYAPGNDPVAATALSSAHVQLILFTTGRGTPFAAPVPTMKVSSNSALAAKKKNWIDFDAGVLVADADKDTVTKQLYEKVIACASGEYVCSEKMGYHDMAIFKRGVTL